MVKYRCKVCNYAPDEKKQILILMNYRSDGDVKWRAYIIHNCDDSNYVEYGKRISIKFGIT
ncbi:MAG: hypothetical protein B655_1025 [Methanobacterium sp. Maddingley MBC34]|nr:MAG: hypothetical protein B655_1025 [Methanobacterium sp. Maddingley MBC34]